MNDSNPTPLKVAIVSSSYVDFVADFINAKKTNGGFWEIAGLWFPESRSSFFELNSQVKLFPLKYSYKGANTVERGNELFASCKLNGVDIIVFVRYLFHVIPWPEYEGRILNVHGSLLPKFGGLGRYGVELQEEILRSGEVRTGCTVHVVTEKYDVGTILAREEIMIKDGETSLMLYERICRLEINNLIKVINRYV